MVTYYFYIIKTNYYFLVDIVKFVYYKMPNKRRSNITNSNDNTLNDSTYSKRPRRSGAQSNQVSCCYAFNLFKFLKVL